MDKFYTCEGTERKGPFSLEQMKDQNIERETLIWMKGMPEWRPAEQIDELKAVIDELPPALPPAVRSTQVPATNTTTPASGKLNKPKSEFSTWKTSLGIICTILIGTLLKNGTFQRWYDLFNSYYGGHR